MESGISGLTDGRASTESKLVVDRYEDNSLEGDTVGQLLQAGPQHLVTGQEGQLELKYNSRSWELSENGEMAQLAAHTVDKCPRLPTGLSVPTHQHLLAQYELVPSLTAS